MPSCGNVRPLHVRQSNPSFQLPSGTAALRLGSRPTDPCATAVGRESCSTPAINHWEDRCSRLNNCYCNQDLHKSRIRIVTTHCFGLLQDVILLLVAGPAFTTGVLALIPEFQATSTFPLHLATQQRPLYRSSEAHRLGRHPLSGPRTSAGELLHTPWRMPTFMATVPLSIVHNALSGIWVSLR